MANKTNKKYSATIEWPKGHFTINDAWQKVGGAATMPNITLRSRLNGAESKKEIVLIGKIKPSIGRPKKVYAKANPTKEVLANAKAAGVILEDDTNKVVAATASVTVAEVKTEKKVKVVTPTVTAPASVPVTDTVTSTASQ